MGLSILIILRILLILFAASCLLMVYMKLNHEFKDMDKIRDFVVVIIITIVLFILSFLIK